MDFRFSEEQQAIRDAVGRVCARYDDAYWLKRDREGGFPDDFVRDIAGGGWLGIAMPEAYGGAGLGVTEAAIVAQTIAESGACLSGASAIHINLFGPMPVVVFGTDAQAENLPPLIAGADRCCFGVTELDAGLNNGDRPGRVGRRLCGAWAEDVDLDGADGQQILLLAHDRRKSAGRRPRGCRFSTPISTGAARPRCARSRRWGGRRSTPTRCFSTDCVCRRKT